MKKASAEQVIDSGALNRRVQIQKPVTTQDSFGQPVMTWTTVYTCWAAIEPYISPRGNGLIYVGSEFLSKASIEITIRWTASVVPEPNMRILYTEGGNGLVHTYNVEDVLNPVSANRQMVFRVYELDGGE